jgi:hypothetical protein
MQLRVSQPKEEEFMAQFLIEIPHAEHNCMELIRLLRAQGDLASFEWGCQSGVHTGWGVITAESEAEARLVIPPLVRRKARVVRVATFDAATVARVEKKEAALPSPMMLRMYRDFPCWW